MPTSKGDPFLKTGIILVSFVSNDLLTSKDMGIEISCIRRLRILTGMLLGPVAMGPGMADLIESAIEVKKSLKELATISGSEDIEFPVDLSLIHI